MTASRMVRRASAYCVEIDFRDAVLDREEDATSCVCRGVLFVGAGNAPDEHSCTIKVAPLHDSKEEKDVDTRRSAPLAPRPAGGNERQSKESEGRRAC